MLTPLKIIETFPYEVTEIPHLWIPLPDGTRLAARLWLPKDANHNPVPAILEYIPYRKRDFTAVRDNINHHYLAGHGYAAIRVDLRGSGESDGVLEDEYLEQELADGEMLIHWISQQSWCDGNVGMMGISWGGFNSLQIAARQPDALKAVITVCSTDDRYADDVHYMGGCLLGDNLSWASTMFAYNACPPDPALVGGGWKDMWLKRLEKSGIWLDTWLTYQHRGDYWKHGSICEEFSSIQCPVFAISGWADGYSNAVFRLLTGLKSSRLGLIGPWSHKYPHMGMPGPAIGFLQEAVRWWDYWLKGIETGIMKEPLLRAWMQDSVPPTTSYITRPGAWIGENTWPSPNIKEKNYTLLPGQIILAAQEPVKEIPLTIQSPLSVGLFAGKWCSYSAGPDLAHDQRQEDGGSLVFDSAPLSETLEILGMPTLNLSFSADKPVAMVAVRLSDVAPDGKATRVTYGLLNLTHRNSHEYPEPLVPHQYYQVQVPLNFIAQVIPRGHRIRVAISTSYWPLVWPSPEPVCLTVYTGSSSVSIPFREQQQDGVQKFSLPEGAPPGKRTKIREGHHNWSVIRDLATDESTLKVIKDDGGYYFEDIDWEVDSKTMEWYSSAGDDFESIRGETFWERSFRRGGWQTQITTRMILTSDKKNFYLQADLDACEGSKRIFRRSWDVTIKRNLL